MFTTTAGGDGALIVRVVDLTPGMRPKLTVRNDKGDLLFDGVYDDQNGGPYLFARLTLTPGTAVTIAVADAAGVPGATYQVSAGAALETQAEQGSAFLAGCVALNGHARVHIFPNPDRQGGGTRGRNRRPPLTNGRGSAGLCRASTGICYLTNSTRRNRQ